MGQEYRQGQGVWAWAPELEEAVDGPPQIDGRGWYPAEVAAVDETDGEMSLNIYTHDDGEAWAASMAVDLEDAEVWIRPRDGSSPPTHEPMETSIFLGFMRPGQGEED